MQLINSVITRGITRNLIRLYDPYYAVYLNLTKNPFDDIFSRPCLASHALMPYSINYAVGSICDVATL